MDIKIILSIIAAIVMIIAYIPYLRDMFYRKTKPHAYTWLIWLITQGTAIVGIWYGGGRWGLASLIVGSILVCVVLLFSLKYGTKNITRYDTIVLILAFLAIFVWWQLKQPLISIIMVSMIDSLGYIPTLRKSYMEPWDETLLTWFLFSVSNILAILALNQYNLMTMLYISAITFMNIVLISFCLIRRKVVAKPKAFK